MILDQLIEKKELLAYCDLRMRRLVKSKRDELARVAPEKREQVAHKIDARIAELAHLKNLVHGGNRQIKDEAKANWRNLNPDVPESYRLQFQSAPCFSGTPDDRLRDELDGLRFNRDSWTRKALDIAAERDAMRDRIAELTIGLDHALRAAHRLEAEVSQLRERIAELDGARVEEMAAKLWYLSCVEELEAESPSGTVCYRWPDEIPPSWAERYRAKARAALAPKGDD